LDGNPVPNWYEGGDIGIFFSRIVEFGISAILPNPD
jgi:hypothetical protein